MKTKKLKQTAALLGAVILLLSACGKQDSGNEASVQLDENVTEAGQLPVVKEPITLEVGIQSSSKVKDFTTNEFTKYLTDKTGINLEFYEFPESGGMEKLNVMLASNSELPEVICGFDISRTTFLEYADKNIFLEQLEV